MNCFNHPDRPAVAQCPDCGKGLCIECAKAHETTICEDCYQKQIENQQDKIVIEPQDTLGQIKSERKTLLREIFFSLIIGYFAANIIIPFLIQHQDTPPSTLDIICTTVIVFCMGAGISYGWKYINPRLQWPTLMAALPEIPFGFLLTIPLFILYPFLKIIGALFIGAVLFPFRLYKNIKRLNELKKMKAACKNGD